MEKRITIDTNMQRLYVLKQMEKYHMSRASSRALKKTFQKDIVEFLKIQTHFLPDFIKALGEVNDPRNMSYTE